MEQQTSKAVLSTFICDFLQSTEGDQPGEPNLSKRPLQTTGQAEQQESASERADRKSARERRRRAEVGEKFDELAKVLASAEGQAPHILTRREVAEGSRVELLQRAIDVVTQLVAATKLTRDEESAAGGLLGVASRGRDGLNGAPRLPASLGAVAAAAVAPAAAAPAPAAKPKAPEPPKKQLSPREALVEALPARCAYPDEESGETYDTSLVGKIEAVAALRDETARTDGELVDMLCGRPWTLRFTSSPSFAFNKGFTGVAGTLPGGAEFEGLTQSVEYGGGANTATYVEVVLPKVALPGQAAAPLDVNVQADWGLKRRFDALARKDQVYLDAVGRSVKYGPVSVDGQRVTRGWKAMRVMNSLAVEYIDDDLRVMKGTTAWFVFTR